MTDPEIKERRMEVGYEYDPAYRLVAANGAHGGITPRGDLRVDFFAEYQALPDVIEVTIDPEGHVREERVDSAQPKLRRRVQVGLLFSIDHVESIANWFVEKAAEIRKIREELNARHQ